MPAWFLALALGLALAPPLTGAEPGRRRAPLLNIDGVVNGATFVPAPENFVAINGIISIFGIDLSLQTRQVRQGDLVRGRLPLTLGGVQVRIGQLLTPLLFVSPLQINAQVPSELPPGDWPLTVSRENLQSTNAAVVRVRRTAPGLFPVVAHSDYTIVGRGEPERSTPARPGEIILLFGTGFGLTTPAVFAGELPDFIAWIERPAHILWNGVAVDDHDVRYVGQCPGFAGLYQVNFVTPREAVAGDAKVAIEIDGIVSPEITVAVE